MAADEGDKNTVLHVYNVENLYAAVVEAYIQWADRPGRSRDPGVVVRRNRHAPPRPPALHPQAGESAAGRQCLSAGPEVALRVQLLPLHVGAPELLPPLGPRRRGVRHLGRHMELGQHLDPAAQRSLRRQSRLPSYLCSAGAHRRGPQDVEEAPQVRRGGPRARRRRPEVQPGTRRRRLHAVPVGQLRRVVRRQSGAGAGRPRARLPAHRTSRARQGVAASVSVWWMEPEDGALRLLRVTGPGPPRNGCITQAKTAWCASRLSSCRVREIVEWSGGDVGGARRRNNRRLSESAPRQAHAPNIAVLGDAKHHLRPDRSNNIAPNHRTRTRSSHEDSFRTEPRASARPATRGHQNPCTLTTVPQFQHHSSI